MLSDLQDPSRLLSGIAGTMRRVALTVDDPYSRRQLQAAVDVLLRVSPSIGWTDEALDEDRSALEATAAILPDAAPDSGKSRAELLISIEHGLQRLVRESSSMTEPTVLAAASILSHVVNIEHRRTQTGAYYEEK